MLQSPTCRKGFHQTTEIDYVETFTHVVSHTTIYIVLANAAASR